MVFIAKLHGEDRMREAERDSIFARLKNLRESAVKTSAVPVQASDEDPMKILQTRFARGELSAQQYEEMKRVLS